MIFVNFLENFSSDLKADQIFYIPNSLVCGLGPAVISNWQKLNPKKHPVYVDCGAYPGLVLSCLRHGIYYLAFQGDPKYHLPLKNVTKKMGAHLIIDPPWQSLSVKTIQAHMIDVDRDPCVMSHHKKKKSDLN